MKKIIAIIFLSALSIVTKAQQDNWDTITVNGFGSGNNFSKIYAANGNIYAGCGQLWPAAPNMYMSSTGAPGSWTVIPGLNALLDSNDYNISAITGTTLGGGYIFAGTDNYQDGGKVLRYDGSTWVNFSSFPAPYDSSNTTISKLVFYSPGGTNDTLYAFTNNYNNGVQVWKTHYAAPNWKLVCAFPYVYQGVGDATVFNDTLFFSTVGASNHFIYKMTNLSDTIRTHVTDGLGGDPINEVTALEVFNGELYAGANNYNGSQLWKLGIGNSWVQVNGDGFGNNSTIREIRDMVSYMGYLFINTNGYPGAARLSADHSTLGGATTVNVYTTSDGATFHRSSPDGFNASNNDGMSYSIVGFGGGVYTGGGSFGSQPAIYHLAIPVASFTDPTTACELTGLTFLNTSQNYTGSNWLLSSVPQAVSTDLFLNASAATYTITLVVDNGFITDTANHVFTIGPAIGAFGVNTLHGPSLCNGDTLKANAAATSGGTPPFFYQWTSGGTLPNFSTDSVMFVPSASDSYTVSVTDASGCTSSYSSYAVTVISSTDLTGNITGQVSGTITSGKVYLFLHQPGSAALDTIFPVMNIGATGDYLYTGLNAGGYLIKAIADTSVYGNAWGTYYGNEYIWDSSTVYVHGCVQMDTANIQVIETIPMTGTAAISGYVAEGPGFGQKLIGGPDHIMVPGGPIRGVDVKLGKNPGSSAAARTFTDTNGYYQFVNVAPGTYRIYVDIPNLPMDSTRQVVINPLDSSVHNDYYVDSAKIYVIDSASVTGIYSSTNKNEERFGIYPNPSNGKATLTYELKAPAQVLLEIYDVLGEKISSVYKGTQQEGKYNHYFDVRESGLRAGVYIVSLRVNNKVSTQRIVVVDRQ